MGKTSVQHFHKSTGEDCIDLKNKLHDMENVKINEKVDGFNFQFGIDDDGLYVINPYTSQVVRNSKDWNVALQNKAFYSAHLALEQISPMLTEFRGTLIDCQLIYHHVSNVIQYPVKNAIYLVKVLFGDYSRAVISRKLRSLKISVDVSIPYTIDGRVLEVRNLNDIWTFEDPWHLEYFPPIKVMRLLNGDYDPLLLYSRFIEGIVVTYNNNEFKFINPNFTALAKDRLHTKNLIAQRAMNATGKDNSILSRLRYDLAVEAGIPQLGYGTNILKRAKDIELPNVKSHWIMRIEQAQDELEQLRIDYIADQMAKRFKMKEYDKAFFLEHCPYNYQHTLEKILATNLKLEEAKQALDANDLIEVFSGI